MQSVNIDALVRKKRDRFVGSIFLFEARVFFGNALNVVSKDRGQILGKAYEN